MGSTRLRIALSGAALLLLMVVSAAVEGQRPFAGPQAWLVPVVGLLLVAAAVAMLGAVLPRVLLALAAAAWLIGSLSAWLLLSHQAVLLVALLALPDGHLVGWSRWYAVLSIPIGLGMLVQPAVGAVFLVAGAVMLAQRRTPVVMGAAAGAVVVGATLCLSWLASRRSWSAFDPDAWLLVYEGALVSAAGALVLGSRASVVRRRGLVDRLVAGSEGSGLAGLAGVLAEALRAPGLVITTPTASTRADEMVVVDGGRPGAVVRHPVVPTLDAETRQSVERAVRLVGRAEERRAALDAQVAALEAAQRRTVAAQDEQRRATATRLRDEVVTPLQEATTWLESAALPADSVASDALEVALFQVRAAIGEIEDLVYGAGPAELGQGRLIEALRSMCSRSPIEVDLRVRGSISAHGAVEAALYYVCAEALVNVHRHARTPWATVELNAEEEHLSLVIRDEGVGGADPDRPGLRGLADRVEMLGGRFRVVSPPGAGTTLTIEIPSGAVVS